MSNKLLQLARPEIVAMSAYRSARCEQSNDEINPNKIWLDANENPFSDENNFGYNRYPEPQPSALLSNLSALYKVNIDQLLVTRGSDEGIDLLVRIFCQAGYDKIITCPPTYGMYKVSATIQNAKVIEIPLIAENNFSLDTKKVIETWDPRVKVIFLCSPNNPTGNLLSTSDILSLCKILEGKAIIVVDEAYIEFANSPSLTSYLNTYPNLVILRTLSKAYGLAGIRCGATIANTTIIQLLKKVIAPYPISKSIVDVACRKLRSNNLEEQIKLINQEKIKLKKCLMNLPYVTKIFDSQTNFLLMQVKNAKEIIMQCIRQNIVVRDRSSELNLNNCIRITIGSTNENLRLMGVLNNG